MHQHSNFSAVILLPFKILCRTAAFNVVTSETNINLHACVYLMASSVYNFLYPLTYYSGVPPPRGLSLLQFQFKTEPPGHSSIQFIYEREGGDTMTDGRTEAPGIYTQTHTVTLPTSTTHNINVICLI